MSLTCAVGEKVNLSFTFHVQSPYTVLTTCAFGSGAFFTMKLSVNVWFTLKRFLHAFLFKPQEPPTLLSSCFAKRAFTFSVQDSFTSLVMILITPPPALLPYKALAAPFTISM